jgi:hypothetical protein
VNWSSGRSNVTKFLRYLSCFQPFVKLAVHFRINVAGLKVVDMPRDGTSMLVAFHCPICDTGVVWIHVKPDSFNIFSKLLKVED